MDALAGAAPTLRAAEGAVARARSTVAGRRPGTWLAPVDGARSAVLAQLDRLYGVVSGAARTWAEMWRRKTGERVDGRS